MAEPIVVVEALHKTFVHMGRPLDVLRGIDLTINQGEIVAIVGSSGAGKSTLLHCIGTLDVPTSGSIRLGRDDVTGLSSAKLAAIRNRAIGFVFQFHHLLPEFSALENVMMPGLIQGKTQREMEPVATALLDEVGLKNRATHRPGELSGGEQQRVALARALALSPKLLLCDEPTGNLDSKTGKQIQDLMFAMNAKHGTTIVVVTHDLGFARSMPRVVTMKDGLVSTDDRSPSKPKTEEGSATPSIDTAAMETAAPSEPSASISALQKNALGLFRLELKKHTGMIVLMQTKTYVVEGTFEQCAEAYQAAQMHNLLAGWWGVLSMLCFNWIAIFTNVSNYGELKKVARR